MKKIYKAPESEILYLNRADILTASNGNDPFKNDPDWEGIS